jgi:hypothetical protein
MPIIDNSDETERLRRKAYIQRSRKANDEAPRPTVSAVAQAKQRAGLLELENEEPHRFVGVDVADLTPLAKQAILDDARRHAAGETKTSGDGLVFKTRAPNRELTGDPRPVVEDEFAAAEAPQPAADADDPWRDWNRWADAKIAAALAGHPDVAELAQATRTFAEAVDARMVVMEATLNRLSVTLSLLRERCDALGQFAATDLSRVN